MPPGAINGLEKRGRMHRQTLLVREKVHRNVLVLAMEFGQRPLLAERPEEARWAK
jgi:hypothetical protein